MNIFMVSMSMIEVRVVSPVTVSFRILVPLMNVVEAIVPPMPMPLPTIVDFMVTSANEGAATAQRVKSANEDRTLHNGHLPGEYLFCCCVAVERGLAFLAHSLAQFSISATVCSTDSRAV